ncbi:MAG: twin-arginine translocase TatA/TatE family subunit [Armatimonadota bacterium]|nr:twin-arginine translocase TatA/TatE family subunit [Armatimonadota bacterium]MDR7486941.1 twin-arginine translocase TatA/TatE family subunit [Armatimonadota bacterium]MDR7533532.1 twin-arginine translocase TatA/TatE family subunit [Armatimonadota bacterium]MDR7536878.1 twin-arginine translocase TatA/TatE family subunit [Armatimonadota bacterium]
MGNVGPMELMVIVLVLLLLFGPSRLAGLGAAAGRTIREFRRAMNDVEEELRNPRPPHPDA